jgi:hypothetical protein
MPAPEPWGDGGGACNRYDMTAASGPKYDAGPLRIRHTSQAFRRLGLLVDPAVLDRGGWCIMTKSVAGLDHGRAESNSRPLLYRRALALWPRLDTRALRRCGQDPRRVAALVSRRTSLPLETIMVLLNAPRVSQEDVATWFG